MQNFEISFPYHEKLHNERVKYKYCNYGNKRHWVVGIAVNYIF
jgi:hypothetical protein